MNSAISAPGEPVLPACEAPGIATSAAGDAETLEWTVHLLRQQPDRLIGIGIAFAMVLLCSQLAFHSLLAGIVCCLLALGAVKEYVAPLSFRLDDRMISVRCAGISWVEMPWEQVRAAYRTPAGLKLSPYGNPKTARTERLRGLTLRFPREMIAKVEERVARHVPIAPATRSAQ